MLALAVCAFTFVSCEKTKESDFEKMIVGTWEETQYYWSYWNAEDGWKTVEDACNWKFDAKGNLTIKYIDYDASYEYNYTITDNKICIIDYAGYSEKYTIESMTSSQMVWKEIDEDGDVYKIKFKKK